MKKFSGLVLAFSMICGLFMSSCSSAGAGGDDGLEPEDDTSLSLSTTFTTAPSGVKVDIDSGSYKDLVVPCETNTTGADLTLTAEAVKMKSSMLQGTLVFHLPSLQGPYKITVNTKNTGSTADGITRYAVITDENQIILAAGPLNPRESGTTTYQTVYSYSGTDTLDLYIQGSTTDTVGATAVNVGLAYASITYSGQGKSDTTAPAEVSNLSAVPDNDASTVALSWDPPTDADFAGVVITYTDGTTAGTPVFVTAGKNTWTSPTLANGAYTFKVAAKDASENTSAGITSAAVTIKSTDTTAPGDVAILSGAADNTTGKVTLTWTDPTDADLDHIEISYTDGSITAGSVSVASAVGTWTSPFLANGDYVFTLVASDGVPNKSAGVSTSSITVAYGDSTAPANVTKLAANNLSSTGDTVVLTWTPPADTDFAGVRISWTGLSAPVTVDEGTNTYTASGLTSGSSYDFVVAAYDAEATPNVSSGVTVTAIPKSGFLEKFTTLNGAATTAQTIAAAGTYTLGNGLSYVVSDAAAGTSKIVASSTVFTSTTSVFNLTIDKSSKPSTLVIPVTGNCVITVGTKGTAGRDLAAVASVGSLSSTTHTETGAAEEFITTYTGGAGTITLSTTQNGGAVYVYFVKVEAL
jgi:hypothetical protein